MPFNLKEDIKPISYIKSHAADMMTYVKESHNPIVITQNGKAGAVLLDIESYQEMKDAFALLRVVRISEEEMKHGKVQDSDVVFTELRNTYFRDDETV